MVTPSDFDMPQACRMQRFQQPEKRPNPLIWVQIRGLWTHHKQHRLGFKGCDERILTSLPVLV